MPSQHKYPEDARTVVAKCEAMYSMHVKEKEVYDHPVCKELRKLARDNGFDLKPPEDVPEADV